MANIHKIGEISYGIKFNVDQTGLNNLKKELIDIQKEINNLGNQQNNNSITSKTKNELNNLIKILDKS